MNILTLSAQDRGGGAADIGHELTRAFRDAGRRCHMAVGTRRESNENVVEIPDSHNGLGGLTLALRDAVRPFLGKVRGAGRLHDFLHCLGRPGRLRDRARGIEDWNLPASHDLLTLAPWKPDIVHAHNLHSFKGPYGHFDLSALPELSHRVPVVLTLHDAWLTTGHCAYSGDCDRWRNGCGDCPDLAAYPPVKKDSTVENWKRKQKVLSESRLYIASPSRWLMERAEKSILKPAMAGARVINNGIDLTLFHPGNKEKEKSRLGFSRNHIIILYAAGGLWDAPRKGFRFAREAAIKAAAKLPEIPITLLALGGEKQPERFDNLEIRYLPFQNDPTALASCYQAADIYFHTALEDNFPTTVLEAMASGLPVIAGSVGGVPEQVTEETGVLIPAGNSEALSEAAVKMLRDGDALKRLGKRAAEISVEKYNMEKQADSYLSWFGEIIGEVSG